MEKKEKGKEKKEKEKQKQKKKIMVKKLVMERLHGLQQRTNIHILQLKIDISNMERT